MIGFLLSPLGRLVGVGALCLLIGGYLGYRVEYGALQALKTANAVALANAVQTARVKKDPLRCGRFPCVDVGYDTEIPYSL